MAKKSASGIIEDAKKIAVLARRFVSNSSLLFRH
jgi:hypothetical protein